MELRESIVKNSIYQNDLFNLMFFILDNYSDYIDLSFIDNDNNSILQRFVWHHMQFINAPQNDEEIIKNFKTKNILTSFLKLAIKQKIFTKMLEGENNFNETIYDNIIYKDKYSNEKWTKQDEAVLDESLALTPDLSILSTISKRLNALIQLIKCPITYDFLNDPILNINSGFSYEKDVVAKLERPEDPQTRVSFEPQENRILKGLIERLITIIEVSGKNEEEKYEACIKAIESYHYQQGLQERLTHLGTDRIYAELLGHVKQYREDIIFSIPQAGYLQISGNKAFIKSIHEEFKKYLGSYYKEDHDGAYLVCASSKICTDALSEASNFTHSIFNFKNKEVYDFFIELFNLKKHEAVRCEDSSIYFKDNKALFRVSSNFNLLTQIKDKLSSLEGGLETPPLEYLPWENKSTVVKSSIQVPPLKDDIKQPLVDKEDNKQLMQPAFQSQESTAKNTQFPLEVQKISMISESKISQNETLYMENIKNAELIKSLIQGNQQIFTITKNGELKILDISKERLEYISKALSSFILCRLIEENGAFALLLAPGKQTLTKELNLSDYYPNSHDLKDEGFMFCDENAIFSFENKEQRNQFLSLLNFGEEGIINEAYSEIVKVIYDLSIDFIAKGFTTAEIKDFLIKSKMGAQGQHKPLPFFIVEPKKITDVIDEKKQYLVVEQYNNLGAFGEKNNDLDFKNDSLEINPIIIKLTKKGLELEGQPDIIEKIWYEFGKEEICSFVKNKETTSLVFPPTKLNFHEGKISLDKICDSSGTKTNYGLSCDEKTLMLSLPSEHIFDSLVNSLNLRKSSAVELNKKELMIIFKDEKFSTENFPTLLAKKEFPSFALLPNLSKINKPRPVSFDFFTPDNLGIGIQKAPAKTFDVLPQANGWNSPEKQPEFLEWEQGANLSDKIKDKCLKNNQLIIYLDKEGCKLRASKAAIEKIYEKLKPLRSKLLNEGSTLLIHPAKSAKPGSTWNSIWAFQQDELNAKTLSEEYLTSGVVCDAEYGGLSISFPNKEKLEVLAPALTGCKDIHIINTMGQQTIMFLGAHFSEEKFLKENKTPYLIISAEKLNLLLQDKKDATENQNNERFFGQDPFGMLSYSPESEGKKSEEDNNNLGLGPRNSFF